MRHFTIIILVVCAILVGGFVYIEYDTNKFIENLSAPPFLRKNRENPLIR